MKVTKQEEDAHIVRELEQRAMGRLRKTRRRMLVSGKSVFALKEHLTKEKK